jgi:hypothetical protein
VRSAPRAKAHLRGRAGQTFEGGGSMSGGVDGGAAELSDTTAFLDGEESYGGSW